MQADTQPCCRQQSAGINHACAVLVCCLQHLEQQGPKYVLDGLKTPLGSRTAAQQLQALHTENLQLKACLKEEVQARQHLERKHGELLELLRWVSADLHLPWKLTLDWL